MRIIIPGFIFRCIPLRFVLGKGKNIVYGMRAELNEPYLFENFELLHEIEQEWKKKHSPRMQLKR